MWLNNSKLEINLKYIKEIKKIACVSCIRFCKNGVFLSPAK